MQQAALSGIRVLDLSQFLSGPRCTQLLAQAGAEVIKIEPPSGETMRLLTWATGTERIMSLVNCDKKSLVLDLKRAEARAVFRSLVAVSDVVVENFGPGAMERMGLGYGPLQEINPRLVYASISGFGRTGPDAERLAFDIIAQATGGILDAYDRPDRTPPIFWADLVSGAYCANGILMALLHRERGGGGQRVDVSMQDVMYFHHFSAQSHRALDAVQEEIRGILGKPVDRLFADPESPVPFWYSYEAQDGYVVIVALTDAQWNGLMTCIGRADLVGDARFDSIVTRVKNARPALAIVSAWMRRHPVAAIVERLHQARVPCGPVLNRDQVNGHPQLRARGMLVEALHPRSGAVPVPGSPIALEKTPARVRNACPDLGAHTDEILREILHLSEGAIAELKRHGVGTVP